MNKAIKYSGRVSSNGNGVFYSAGQTVGQLSSLPTKLTENYETFYLATSNPQAALKAYPKLLVTLGADGLCADIEHDLVYLDAEGNHVPSTEVVVAPPVPKTAQATAPKTEQEPSDAQPE